MTDTTDQENQDLEQQDQESQELESSDQEGVQETSETLEAEGESLQEAEETPIAAVDVETPEGEIEGDTQGERLEKEEDEAFEEAKDEDPIIEGIELQRVIEGALFAAGEPLSISKIQSLFEESKAPSKEDVTEALEAIQLHCEGRGYALKEVGNGWRFFVQPDTARWVNRLWDEKPQKYSRALLETLALIAYRQPLTRGDIEEVRGVAVSSHIIKTLTERDWVKVVGHRDVPGRPALYATTKTFLDYFNLKSLDELPSLGELKDIDSLNADLEFEEKVIAEINEANAAVLSSDAANDTDEDAPSAESDGESAETVDAEVDADAEGNVTEEVAEQSESSELDGSQEDAQEELQDESQEDAQEQESLDTEDGEIELSNEVDEVISEDETEQSSEEVATEEENPNG